MGGSSKQTVGYKYFAGLQVAIGNCIEYMININPDNRGWIFTKPEEIDLLKTGDTSITVNKPNLFGGDKAEGGWVGTIDIHTGKPSTLRQNEYLAEQDNSLVSSFPYLSHLVFRGPSLDKGFQLVSMSGMLKDVLYWPKRIHIKDDGSPQWYDEKSEIGLIYSPDISQNSKYKKLDIIFTGKMSWVDPSGTYEESYGVGEFPFYDSEQSYQNAGIYNGPPMEVQPSQIAVGPIISSNNMTVDFSSGADLPPCTWTSYPPETDGFYNGAIARRFTYKSNMIWSGGSFRYRAVLSENGASIYINKKDETGSVTNSFVITAGEGDGFQYISSSVNLENGNYEIIVDTGTRYNLNNTPRPFVYLEVLYKKNIDALNTGDINPIHKIREIITDDTAMNKPEAMINDANFIAAADRIWDEGLGVSGSFTEKSCKEAIDEMLYHIEAGIRINRQTGLYEIVLFRDDLLDLDNAQLFDKSNIKNFSIETANIDDLINSVNVNYYDRDNIKDSSFSLDELGSILSNQSNTERLDFPYFMNRRNAELVGNWKLKQLSTPTRKGTFTTGKYDARKINRYDVVKLTWHNQNMIEVPIRIMKIGLGDGRDNTVTLDWVEVIPYSSIVFPTINFDPPTSAVLPPQPNQSIAFEMPYFEAVQRFGQTQVDTELANNHDLGYLMVATKKPQNNSINALLFTDNSAGYQQASIVDYCPVVQLDQDISYLDTSFAVKNVSSISQAEVGTLIYCDEELMVYQSYDDVTKILTVKRAALDTVPKPHLQDAVFYFYDAFSAFDSEQYVLSEVINAKVLTTTPNGIQELSDVTALSVEMNARQNRPYPPANVKINDEYYPAQIEGDLVLTWVDRNRLQQTGGSILGWTDAGVSLEINVSYILIVYEIDSENVEIEIFNQNVGAVNTYTVDLSISTQSKFRLVLKSLRDSYESYQAFDHILNTTFSAPYNIEYTLREV